MRAAAHNPAESATSPLQAAQRGGAAKRDGARQSRAPGTLHL